MAATYPKTDSGAPIPVLSFRAGVTLALAPGAANQRKALPTSSRGGAFDVVTVRAVDAAVRCKLGGSSVTCSSTDGDWHFLLDAGEERDVPVREGETHLACAETAGTVAVMGRE